MHGCKCTLLEPDQYDLGHIGRTGVSVTAESRHLLEGINVRLLQVPNGRLQRHTGYEGKMHD